MPNDKPIEQEAHVFYGIYHGYLYIQIATHCNHIKYKAKIEVSEKPTTKEIKKAIPKLFDSVEVKKIKLPKSVTYQIDGSRIKESGRIHTEETGKVEGIYKSFWKDVSKYLLWEE